MTEIGDDPAEAGGVADPAASIQIKLRVKPVLRTQLQESASENGISLNEEIVRRLLRSFIVDAVLAKTERQYEKLQRRVDAMGEEMDKLHDQYLQLLSKVEGGGEQHG